MNPISAEIVEKTWQEMNAMSPLEAPKMINKLTKEQPIILAYLMAVGHDFLNQDEQELLLYLGIVVWRIMSQGDSRLPKVSEKVLDSVDESNIKMLEYLEGESETEFAETIETIYHDYNQTEVLKYIVEALFEEDEEETKIRDEVKGMMFIYLKTVVDCLDK